MSTMFDVEVLVPKIFNWLDNNFEAAYFATLDYEQDDDEYCNYRDSLCDELIDEFFVYDSTDEDDCGDPYGDLHDDFESVLERWCWKQESINGGFEQLDMAA